MSVISLEVVSINGKTIPTTYYGFDTDDIVEPISNDGTYSRVVSRYVKGVDQQARSNTKYVYEVKESLTQIASLSDDFFVADVEYRRGFGPQYAVSYYNCFIANKVSGSFTAETTGTSFYYTEDGDPYPVYYMVKETIAQISAQTYIGSLVYLGLWDANSNTPGITSGVGFNGNYYIVGTAGSTNIDGITDWEIGDWIIFNGSVWQKIDNTGITYSGTWDAGTNSPTLTSSVGKEGHFYIVSNPGSTNLNGITDWRSGDWAIFTNGVWLKIDNSDPIPNVQSVVSAPTVTPTSSNDEVVITAQASALFLANPTGTTYQGQSLVIRIKDNGTARAITYDSQYRAIGVTLPTTTVINKTVYLGLIFNSTDSKWDVIGVAQEV